MALLSYIQKSTINFQVFPLLSWHVIQRVSGLSYSYVIVWRYAWQHWELISLFTRLYFFSMRITRRSYAKFGIENWYNFYLQSIETQICYGTSIPICYGTSIPLLGSIKVFSIRLGKKHNILPQFKVISALCMSNIRIWKMWISCSPCYI